MLGEKEYSIAIRNYIAANITNNNVYSYLKPNEVELITNYYKAYTVELFKRLRGSLRLKVSDAKAKKLLELKGSGSWDFAGMDDKGKVGKAHCELGHALRYCYYARNTTNGSVLKFGVTCVGDFFDLDEEGIKSLNKVKDTMLSELKEVVAIKQLNLTEEHLKYDLGMYGRLLKKIGLEGVSKLKHNKRYSYALAFIGSGLPLPESLATFLNDDNTLVGHITPSLIGLESYIPLSNSKITLIAEGYKGLCDLEVLKIVDPKKANYSRDIIGKYIDFTDVRRWTYRERFLIALHDAFAKEGIDNWGKLSLQIEHYLKNESLNIDNGALVLATNLMNSFSLDSKVQRYNFGGVNTLPYKVNSVVVNKKAIKNMDYLLKQLNEDENILNVLKSVKEYTNYKVESALAKLSDEERVIRYLRDNISKPKYAVIGKGIGITKDIVINRGKTLDTMTESQKKVVLNVHRLMTNMDKEDGISANNEDISTVVDANNVYLLKDREDIREKIDFLLKRGIPDKLVNILKTVLKYEKVSDKQLKYIYQAYDNIVNSNKNNSYFLDEREDVKNKIIKVVNSNMFDTLDVKTKGIFNTVLRNGRFSDKQLKYIYEAYNKLTDIIKNDTTNNKYILSDRPDLQNMVNTLKSRNDLDDKTNDILHSVLKYGRVTDKQLKYINVAYMNTVIESC